MHEDEKERIVLVNTKPTKPTQLFVKGGIKSFKDKLV